MISQKATYTDSNTYMYNITSQKSTYTGSNPDEYGNIFQNLLTSVVILTSMELYLRSLHTLILTLTELCNHISEIYLDYH